MRMEYETEMEELRQKMESEKETKAKMATEVEKMKKEYEEKLRCLEAGASIGKVNRSEGGVQVSGGTVTVAVQNGQVGRGDVAGVQGQAGKSQEQQDALAK